MAMFGKEQAAPKPAAKPAVAEAPAPAPEAPRPVVIPGAWPFPMGNQS